MSYAPPNVKVNREPRRALRGKDMQIGDITLRCVDGAARTIGMRPALLALRLLQGGVDAIDLFESGVKIDTEHGQQFAKSA